MGRKLSEILEAPEAPEEGSQATALAQAEEPSSRAEDADWDERDTNGEAVLRQSASVAAKQQQYDRLVAQKQACEAKAIELANSLQAAMKRQQCFSLYLEG